MTSSGESWSGGKEQSRAFAEKGGWKTKEVNIIVTALMRISNTNHTEVHDNSFLFWPIGNLGQHGIDIIVFFPSNYKGNKFYMQKEMHLRI